MNDETAGFHRLVAEGSVAELQAALRNGAAVNAPGHVGRTALMVALESHDLEKAQLLVQHGADPEQTDDFNATALRRAVEADFADGVRWLLSLGVDRGYRPRYLLKQINYGPCRPDVPLPEELRGVLSEEQWRDSLEEGDRAMRELGRNPTVEPMITTVQSVAVLQLLLAAGDDLNLAPREIKRQLLGLQTGGELRVSPSEYRRHKSPSFGSRNPERMDFPFWQDMIRTGVNAYLARRQFLDDDPFARPGAVWCYERFGSSLTPLDDGRYIQIGGEHEDDYDPDFFIYNDVVIHDGQGNCQIYGYPCDVFPPTDFQSATLCGDGVFIVGGLGYPEQRQPGYTPVYRLTLESWRMERIDTTGAMPGWIYQHRAHYDPERNVLVIVGGEIEVANAGGERQQTANEGRFELDLTRRQWRRLD